MSLNLVFLTQQLKKLFENRGTYRKLQEKKGLRSILALNNEDIN